MHTFVKIIYDFYILSWKCYILIAGKIIVWNQVTYDYGILRTSMNSIPNNDKIYIFKRNKEIHVMKNVA